MDLDLWVVMRLITPNTNVLKITLLSVIDLNPVKG